MNLHPNLRPLKIICLAGFISAGIACNGPSSDSKLPAADTLHIKGEDTLHLAGDTSKDITTPPLTMASNMDGKYPADVKLFDDPVLVTRLQAIMGKQNYQLLRENWNVESPITLQDNIFTAEGCMQHNCGYTNFIIVADLKRDKLYAGIREDSQVKTFGEDSTFMSGIAAWSNRKED